MRKIDLFLFLNLFCNDRCGFCFFSKWPPGKKKNFLTLEDVKKAIYETGEDKIHGMVLTGGEPTLNPHFWKIIDYISCAYLKTGKIKGFDLSTNAITSANKEIAQKIEQYFSPFKKNNLDIKISFSFSAPDDPSNKQAIDKKIQGVKNLMKLNSNLECVVTITNDNYCQIMSITKFLLDLYKKRKTKKYFFKIDYRLPYVSMMFGFNLNDLKQLIPFPKDFSRTLNSVLEQARKEALDITLHNIPLCYIKNKAEYFIGRKPLSGISVFPGKKLKFIKRGEQFKFGKAPACRKCKLKDQCDGIEKIYLEKFNYPAFRAFN